MHDIADLEARQVPGVFIASTEFVTAADAQAQALGIEPKRVLVSHPIQDRTDEEMRSLADAAIDDIVAALVVQAD